MVRFQVVDLLAEDEHPEVFAEEFDYVESVCEAGSVAGESISVIVSIDRSLRNHPITANMSSHLTPV